MPAACLQRPCHLDHPYARHLHRAVPPIPSLGLPSLCHLLPPASGLHRPLASALSSLTGPPVTICLFRTSHTPLCCLSECRALCWHHDAALLFCASIPAFCQCCLPDCLVQVHLALQYLFHVLTSHVPAPLPAGQLWRSTKTGENSFQILPPKTFGRSLLITTGLTTAL